MNQSKRPRVESKEGDWEMVQDTEIKTPAETAADQVRSFQCMLGDFLPAGADGYLQSCSGQLGSMLENPAVSDISPLFNGEDVSLLCWTELGASEDHCSSRCTGRVGLNFVSCYGTTGR